MDVASSDARLRSSAAPEDALPKAISSASRPASIMARRARNSRSPYSGSSFLRAT